jgi:predicted ArsR family transcriptional regulator
MTVDAQPDLEASRTPDPRAIRALTHPVRLALLEALTLYGPLTATQAGEKIGETATTCSFHLRQLGRYGFVVDDGVPGRRDRPWRLAERDITLTRDGQEGSAFAAAGLESLLHARAVQRWEAWRRESAQFAAEWQRAAPFRSWLVHMTAAELAELDARLGAYMREIEQREQPPPGAVPVQIVAYGHPVTDVEAAG